MREIKFRTWSDKLKIMGEVVSIDYRIKRITAKTVNNFFWDDLFDDLKLMQYTGLKDKNDNEIYEGDLIKWGTNTVWTINFEKGSFWLGINMIGKRTIRNICDEIEIIGNIHENGDLL